MSRNRERERAKTYEVIYLDLLLEILAGGKVGAADFVNSLSLGSVSFELDAPDSREE